MSETFTERQRRDLAHNWHPCTQMADHEEWPPLAVRSARGVWLEDETGRRILDGISSWWVNLFGHGHPRLVETLARQAERLDHCLFAGCTHDPAIELGERLAALSGLPRVFYADNGSCAVETALKMSFHAHRNAGAVGRTRFAHLGGSYHGETLGALGVGDLGLYGEVYRPLLRPGVRVEGPDCFRCPYGLTREGCGVPCLDRDRRTLEAHEESLCGVIVEPLVQGAAGMRVYPPAYLAGLRQVCSDLGIHLIDDEIAMGFGRTGTLFACQQAGVVPDLMCLSKGITGGMIPFSVVLASEEIYRAFYGGGVRQAFLHSHSYSGSPLGCALACTVLDLFEEEGILDRVARLGRFLRERVASELPRCPHLGEYRQIGLVGALELVADPGTRAPFPPDLRLGRRIARAALDRGVLLRPLGEVVYFLPPYAVTEEDLEVLAEGAFGAVREVLGSL